MSFFFFDIFRLAFVEKTRESDDEKKEKGERDAERERNYHKLNAIK